MKIYSLKGDIRLLSGLHIGGGDDVMKIGGIDNQVIKDANSGRPYIPASSLKGKIRSLLEWDLGLVGLDQDSYQYKVKLQGQTEDLWVEVYSTELGYHEKPEDKEYGVGISQYRRHAS